MAQAGCRLKPVTDPRDWQDLHRIRQAVLWVPRGRTDYDANHPDDRHPDPHPLLLTDGDTALGVVRIDDRRDGTGIVRLVAIVPEHQGRGLGRRLDEAVQERARQFAIHTLHVNAAPDAVGFYEATGWHRFTWDAAELVGHAADCIQMRKVLMP